MKNIKKIAFVAAVTVTTLFSVSAQATLTTYTNLALFEAAAGATSLETFSTATPNVSGNNFAGTFNGFSLSSVANGNKSGISTGSISGSDNTAIPANFSGQNFYGWGEGTQGNVGPTTTFSFGRAVQALGFDWFDTDVTDSYSLKVNALTTVVFNYKSSGFFGVIASAGESFTTASIQTFTDGGFISTEGFDNVRVSAVPEPTSLALLGLGILGFVASRRKATKHTRG